MRGPYRKCFAFALWISLSTAGAVAPVSDGVLYVKSQHSVSDTVERAKRMMLYHKFRVFGVIDHAGEAVKSGDKLLPTQLLVFGKPEAGTKMMQANRLIGLDLPMKLLVWEDEKGVVWISYNSAEYLASRHQNLSLKIAKKMADVLREMAEAAAR